MSTLVIVSCADSGQLHTLALDDATGHLAPRQVLDLGGTLMPMAQHPSLPRLYVARRSEPLAVISLSIAGDGTLAPLHEAPLPQSMAYLSCDRSGRWLLSASYGGHCVAIGPINDSGVAGAATQLEPAGPNAHAIVADPANRFVWSTALGAHALYRFALDARQGRLLPTEPPTVPVAPGAGPRHLVFNADGTRLYLLNELDGGIDVLACEPAAGTLRPLQRLSCLPAGLQGAPWAAELRLSADGTRLLATERRSSTLSVLAVDRGSGELSLLARHPVEAEPRGMQLSPDGRHVLVAGQASHHLSCLALDPTTGALTPRARLPVGLNPNWVETRRLAH